MYKKIEQEFLTKSWRRNETRLIRLIYFIYVISAIIIATLTRKVWYSYIVSPILALIVIYCQMYFALKRNGIDASFLKLKDNRKKYINERKNNDIKTLIDLLKSNSINTRPKVKEVITHYHSLTPRNIMGSGFFMSILAIIVSVVAFIVTENNNLSVERFSIMIAIIILLSIFYLMVQLISEVMRSFSKVELYLYIEDLLSIIYFKSLIK